MQLIFTQQNSALLPTKMWLSSLSAKFWGVFWIDADMQFLMGRKSKKLGLHIYVQTSSVSIVCFGIRLFLTENAEELPKCF